jgi:hypothetical protein
MVLVGVAVGVFFELSKEQALFETASMCASAPPPPE